MWTYRQSTGLVEDPQGFARGLSYAGRGEGRNNPQLEDVRAGCRWNQDARMWLPVDGLTGEDWGPLPCGIYLMQEPVNTTTHGPYVIWLTPDPANQMFGRSEFGWHGDSLDMPGFASEGCICSPQPVRHMAWTMGDHRLWVIPR
jgi:hypothetical protein